MWLNNVCMMCQFACMHVCLYENWSETKEGFLACVRVCM